MKIKICNEIIQRSLAGDVSSYPKYATQIMNLANQNAQGTRPKIVGQMSELIQEFGSGSISDWENWYKERYPDAIDLATEKVYNMILLLKESIDRIDEETVKRWIKELVVVKTYTGLRFQKVILETIAELKGSSYRLSTPDEESKGIDGYIGEHAVSIKPNTYKIEQRLPEHIDIPIIYYEKIKDGLNVECDF